jgi:hypothetical protein
MRVSVALAVQDKARVGSLEGDIIDVRPAGWIWGYDELKLFLIAEIDLGAAVPQLDIAQLLGVQLYAQDRVGDDAILQRTGKRRFRVLFSEIERLLPLDRAKLVDPAVIYQPLTEITPDPVTHYRLRALYALPLTAIYDRFRNRALTTQRLNLLAAVRVNG